MSNEMRISILYLFNIFERYTIEVLSSYSKIPTCNFIEQHPSILETRCNFSTETGISISSIKRLVYRVDNNLIAKKLNYIRPETSSRNWFWIPRDIPFLKIDRSRNFDDQRLEGPWRGSLKKRNSPRPAKGGAFVAKDERETRQSVRRGLFSDERSRIDGRVHESTSRVRLRELFRRVLDHKGQRRCIAIAATPEQVERRRTRGNEKPRAKDTRRVNVRSASRRIGRCARSQFY